MPTFEHLVIGDFDIEVKPIGRLRAKPLIRSLAPYFIGDLPKMKLIIKSVSGGNGEFNAELLLNEPCRHKVDSPFLKIHGCCPFEAIVESPKLTNYGGYVIQLTILSEKGRGGQADVAFLPAMARWG